MGYKVAPADLRDPSEYDRVAAMRLSRLLEAGYPIHMAEQLADDFHVELHRAEDLAAKVLASGLDIKVAFKILI